MSFVKAAKLSDVPPGKCKAVEIAGKKVAIFNIGGTLYAVEDSCTHMGIPLSEGFTGKGSVTCHWHGATFDLTTGEALSAPATEPIEVYQLRVVQDDIEVEV